MNNSMYAFCVTDQRYYDLPHRGPASDMYRNRLLPLPPGWEEGSFGIWRSLRPAGQDIPTQGWKIHISATPDNAEHIMASAYEYCISSRLAFKHLLSGAAVDCQCGKGAPRSGNGKAVTIYPRDEAELACVIEVLGARLNGLPGPYLLTDLRIESGPLHVRYGAFVSRWMWHDNEWVAAMRDPFGRPVPDIREPQFRLPEGVRIPNCLEAHLDARRMQVRVQFPYRIEQAIHFSDGGGVYLAADPSKNGNTVVIKEARPYTAYDRNGLDSVPRLENEGTVLKGLEGIQGVPRNLARFTAWEHHYLALEQLPGRGLMTWISQNYPLSRPDPTVAAVSEYTRMATTIAQELEKIVARIHDRGYVHGDIHPNNILVDHDARVHLIDFEAAAPIATATPAGIAAPGFQADADARGRELDEFAVAAVKAELFLPLGPLRAFAPQQIGPHLDYIARRFPLPPDYTESIRRGLGAQGTEEHHGATAVSEHELIASILASATPGRTDRLFPGDIRQFTPTVGGLGFNVGAAGVLYALSAAGAGRFPELENWLIDAVRTDPPHTAGFSDGAAGIAYVLSLFGYHDIADALIARYTKTSLVVGHDLESGLSGIGLTLLALSSRAHRPTYVDYAVRIGLGLRIALTKVDPVRDGVSGGTAGLLRGWCGAALLFVHLFEHSGDESWLDWAERAIRIDLAQCVPTADGAALQVSDGGRVLPYLGTGSAGILVTLDRLARHRPGAATVATADALLQAICVEFVGHPGVMQGRAGLILCLAGLRKRPDNTLIDRALDQHMKALELQAVVVDDGVAFPGDQLLRLSMDVATGTAGILLAMAAARGNAVSHPFLTPVFAMS